ncbi:MAG: Gfo/Idh/MocA family oxidoreductase [Verrucomicrobiae bacterium]|nr:Gfo/Idh/MocA family oxidoreductase [Verrucomicrobiae bacterium]
MKRREFLRQVVKAVVAAPLVLRGGRAGAVPANARVTMACIGVGAQGENNTRQFLNDVRVQVVAVCDVDLGRARSVAAMVDKHYGQKGCAVTQDFRELLVRSDIDTVMIGTPDHTHAVIAVAAARGGKDIYCEKPLAYSVAEGRAIVEAVRRYGRVLQTGTQRRSQARFQRGCELVRNGRIGRLRSVRCIPGRGIAVRGGFTGEEPSEPVPPDFDYDLWLGPAPWVPYSRARCHFNFRWISDYSDGQISDNGVHAVDLATWALGVDESGPVWIDGRATFAKSGIYDVPVEFEIRYRYANGAEFTLVSGDSFGVHFEGSEGWIHMSGWDVTASSEKILKSEIGHGEFRAKASRGHHLNFIDCVLSRQQPVTPAELGHRAATVCHLGYISCVLGRPLKWDPVREVFPDDPSANRYLGRAMREPWTL